MRPIVIPQWFNATWCCRELARTCKVNKQAPLFPARHYWLPLITIVLTDYHGQQTKCFLRNLSLIRFALPLLAKCLFYLHSARAWNFNHGSGGRCYVSPASRWKKIVLGYVIEDDGAHGLRTTGVCAWLATTWLFSYTVTTLFLNYGRIRSIYAGEGKDKSIRMSTRVFKGFYCAIMQRKRKLASMCIRNQWT